MSADQHGIAGMYQSFMDMFISTLIAQASIHQIFSGQATSFAYQSQYSSAHDIRIRAYDLSPDAVSAGRKERMSLNSADRTFREVRDMSFAAGGPRLSPAHSLMHQDASECACVCGNRGRLVT